jgi:hypothetical protein
MYREWRLLSERLKTVLINSSGFRIRNTVTKFCVWNVDKQELTFQLNALRPAQELLLKIINKRNPSLTFSLLIINSFPTLNALTSGMNLNRGLYARNLEVFVILESNNEDCLVDRSRSMKYLLSPKSEVSVRNIDGETKISLCEHEVV